MKDNLSKFQRFSFFNIENTNVNKNCNCPYINNKNNFATNYFSEFKEKKYNFFNPSFYTTNAEKNSVGVDKRKKEIRKVGSMKNALQEYKHYLSGEYQKATTKTTYYYNAKKLLEFTKNKIDKDSIQKWKIFLNENYNHNSITFRSIATNNYLDFIGKSHLKIKYKKYQDVPKQILSEDEFDKLIFESKKDPETSLIMALLVDSKLRPSDIINIKISGIILIKDGYYKLYFSDSKTGSNFVILSKKVKNIIDKYIKEVRPQPKPKQQDYLFLSTSQQYNGYHYNKTDFIRKRIKTLAKNTGIKKNVTPYTLRNSIITLNMDQDSKYYVGDPKKVQLMARHKNLKTTMKYNCITDDHIINFYKTHIDRVEYKPNKDVYKPQNNGYKELLNSFSPQIYITIDENDNNSYSFSFSISFDNSSNNPKVFEQIVEVSILEPFTIGGFYFE